MTAQSRETLILDGALEDMGATPLDDHPVARNFDFKAHTGLYATNCHRGYEGVWELHDGRLWLVGLFDANSEPMDTRPIFGGQGFPILADWFSGTLVLLRGPRLMYVHFGWGGVYAQQLRLYLRDGVLIRQRRYDQTKRFRRYYEEWAGAQGLQDWLREPDREGLAPLSWFTPAGLEVLGVDPSTVAPGWATSDDDDDLPRPWDWELERVGQCRRPAGAPRLKTAQDVA